MDGWILELSGDAFVLVRTISGAHTRVLLRGDAEVVQARPQYGPQALQVGDTVILNLGTEAGAVRAVSIISEVTESRWVRRLEGQMTCPPVGLAIGAVVALMDSRMQVQPRCGAGDFELFGSPIARITHASAADLLTGQRVHVQGELLVDGTLAADFVIISEPP